MKLITSVVVKSFEEVVLVIPALVVIMAVSMMLAGPVLAQGQQPDPNLPPTAQEAMAQVALILAAVGGILASYATDWIKSIPLPAWFAGEDKAKIGGAVSQLIVVVVSVGTGYLISWLAQYAGQVDSSGLWGMILKFGPLAFAELRYQLLKLRQAQEFKTQAARTFVKTYVD